MLLDDPFLWRIIKWIIIIAIIVNGSIKWNEKNRFKVGSDTVKFPHIHFTIFSPTRGIEDAILQITVAPHNDICPHGRTYPKKAVIMVIIKIISPDLHNFLFFVDIFNILRYIWMKINMKITDTPVEWRYLNEYPFLTFFDIST